MNARSPLDHHPLPGRITGRPTITRLLADGRWLHYYLACCPLRDGTLTRCHCSTRRAAVAFIGAIVVATRAYLGVPSGASPPPYASLRGSLPWPLHYPQSGAFTVSGCCVSCLQLSRVASSAAAGASTTVIADTLFVG